MARNVARPAVLPDAAPKADPIAEKMAPAKATLPRGDLDPLVLALTRAVDRQSPARVSALRDERAG